MSAGVLVLLAVSVAVASGGVLLLAGGGADPSRSEAEQPRADAEQPRADEGVRLPAAQGPAACLPAPSSPVCRIVQLAPTGGAVEVTVAGDVALFVDADAVAAVELLDGTTRWRQVPFDGSEPASIVADDRMALVARPGTIARLDLSAGRIEWKVPVGAGDRAAPRVWLLAGGILAFDADGVLHSIDRDTGAVRWSVEGFESAVDMTPVGLLLRLGTDVGVWAPDSPTPRWLRSDIAGHARELPPGSILGVLDGATQLDPATGNLLPRRPGSVVVHVGLPAGLNHLDVRWREGTSDAIVVAIDATGRPLWTSAPLALPCCAVRAVPAGERRLALASRDGAAVILEATTGRLLATLQEPGMLLGVDDGIAVWSTPDEIIARRLDDGHLVLRARGQVVSLDPLVIDDPQGIVAVLWDQAVLVPPQQPTERNRDG